MVAVALDALITFTIEAALVGCWTAERDGEAAVEESVDLEAAGWWSGADGRRSYGMVEAAGWIGGMVAALAGRIGGFGGAVACETAEPDYIWRCNITKISPSFHLRDARMAGHNGKFVAKYWRWEGRSPRIFQGARVIFPARAPLFRVPLFFLLLFFS